MLKLTKNQSLILSVLFANPDKSFYFRELGRMLNKQPGVFQRDINKLEESGILKSSYQGTSRFFALNKSHYLYKEIKNIIVKTTGLEIILAKALKSIPRIQRAFIYGSFANKTFDNFSDLDLIIIGQPEQKLLDNVFKHLEQRFNREINYLLYSTAEFQKKKKNDLFLKEVLKGKIIPLILNEEI